MIRIPLGTYSLEQGEEMKRKYNECRQHKERDKHRLRSHILLRGRGNRNLWVNEFGKPLRPICSSPQKDIPLKYAQRVAVYLIINERIEK